MLLLWMGVVDSPSEPLVTAIVGTASVDKLGIAGSSAGPSSFSSQGSFSSGTASGGGLGAAAGGTLDDGKPDPSCTLSGFVTPSAKLTLDALDDRLEEAVLRDEPTGAVC